MKTADGAMTVVEGFGEATNDNGGKVKGFSMAIW